MKAVCFVLLGKRCILLPSSFLGLFRRKSPGNKCCFILCEIIYSILNVSLSVWQCKSVCVDHHNLISKSIVGCENVLDA